jgi:hypothetical protein
MKLSEPAGGQTYFGAELRQQHMNEAANNVIAPHLVLASEGLCCERLDAVVDPVVHRVVPNASLVLLGADALDGAVHDRGGVGIHPGKDSCEEIERWDPGVVLEDRALRVEAPKCDL